MLEMDAGPVRNVGSARRSTVIGDPAITGTSPVGSSTTDPAYPRAGLLPAADACGSAVALHARPIRAWARARRSSWRRAWITAKSSAARGWVTFLLRFR